MHALYLPRTPRQLKKEHNWKGRRKIQMSAALPTEDTKAAEEVPLMSEVAKARVADDDSQSTLSRLAKMDNSRRQAVLSQVLSR
jgi:hypothetical protein